MTSETVITQMMQMMKDMKFELETVKSKLIETQESLNNLRHVLHLREQERIDELSVQIETFDTGYNSRDGMTRTLKEYNKDMQRLTQLKTTLLKLNKFSNSLKTPTTQ
jgi:predicted nuclease with TOPRIM domain